jgi:hypothetical protein
MIEPDGVMLIWRIMIEPGMNVVEPEIRKTNKNK